MSRKTWVYLTLALAGLALILLTGCAVRRPPLFSTRTPTASPTAPLPFPIPPTRPAQAPTPASTDSGQPAPTAPIQPDTAGGRRLFLPFAPFKEAQPSAARVLIISIDGLRPDAVYDPKTGQVNAPFLYALSQAGAVSWTAQTIKPSTTLPGHASMLSGYDVPKHGLDTINDGKILTDEPYIPVLAIFDRARAHGLWTVMVAGKTKMDFFQRPGSLDAVVILADEKDEILYDLEVLSEALKMLRSGFGLMFIHFPDVDRAGHSAGWMSSRYLGTVRRVDRSISKIFERLGELGLLESTLVFITADHAGNDWGHTGSGPLDRTIPWMVLGPGVRAGTSLAGASIQIMDTTATALWALGIPTPADLDGRPVLEAFLAPKPPPVP